ncbi:MAG: hypothetical protein U0W40_13485 [Acidimicrobiia bacterium]
MPFDQVVAYDDAVARAAGGLPPGLAGHRGLPRRRTVDDGKLRGYALLRPAADGWRFGPFHADDPATAERIAAALLGRIAGDPVALDVPTPNSAAVALAERHGLTPGFVCARMYDGPPPAVDVGRCYGVTSLEFG